jgi:predicted PhzF superfamily epimerase YddE/YHI9
MQKVASEFNMMTAFLVPRASEINAQSQVEAALDNNHYEIRTFTPISEVWFIKQVRTTLFINTMV